MEKKLDGNYTRMLQAILNKPWRQHPTKPQLYGHLPAIPKTIQVRRTRHAGHCWRSRDELISDILLWTPSHGQGKAGRLARTNIQQLCADTGCSLEDLLEAMDDREGWQERVKEICAGGGSGGGTTWWWGGMTAHLYLNHWKFEMWSYSLLWKNKTYLWLTPTVPRVFEYLSNTYIYIICFICLCACYQ